MYYLISINMKKRLAERVYEHSSKPLKTCWLLDGLEDFNQIIYAPGCVCKETAQEMEQQIRQKYHHPVKIKTLEDILVKQPNTSYETPDDEMKLTLWLINQLAAPKTLFVCSEKLRYRLMWLNYKMTTPLKIVSPESFGLDYFPEFEDTDELDVDFPVAKKRIVKPVSYILVLSTADEVWNAALQLYKRHRKTYPDKKVEMVLVLDCDNRHYTTTTRRCFARRCKYMGCTPQEIKWSEIAKQNIADDSLWVLPQSKSHFIQKFPKSLYYIKEANIGYWWMRSKCDKELLLQDIKKMAEQEKSNDTASEFLRTYIPQRYKEWKWKIYWEYRRLCRFNLELI